jgi:hypothetical protein
MRSAALRSLLFVALALGGVSAGAATAGELDPIGDVTSVVSTVVSQTTVISDLTGGATSGGSASGATDAISESGAVDVLSGSSGGSADSTTAGGSSSGANGSGSTSTEGSSRSSASSNPGSPRTRFDRLPRRYERLLERIEFGRHLRANIARLRALLGSASPQLRARVLRLIRLEIRRLERGGLTRRERAAVRRLRGLLATLQPPPSGRVTRAPLLMGRGEGSGVLSATAGGATARDSTDSGSGARGTPDRGRRSPVGGALPGLPSPPPPPGSLFYWPLLVLGAVALVFVLLLRALRQFLPSAVRGTVEVDQPDNWAATVTIGVGLLTCLVVLIALIQALR